MAPIFSQLRLPASLRSRVLVLTLLAFAAISVPAVLAFNWIVDATILRLGTMFAEKQVLYDRHRGLEALIRETALAETLSRSPAILDWAADEEHGGKRARGLRELEHFRTAFRDGSYFFVIGQSGNYYFNDRDNAYSGRELRYTLSPDNPRDGWYYATAAAAPASHPCQLNVDHDDNLAVTKVWINCVVTQSGRTIGILGTGIELTEFIRDVVAVEQPGVQSMFIDRSGAIQAHRDRDRISYQSLTKAIDARKTIFDLVSDERSRATLADMMRDVSSHAETARSEFLNIGGERLLVGVSHLDRIGWFNVSLMDVDEIIDRRLFLPVGLLLAALMAAIAGLMTMLFKRRVLDRIGRVEAAIERVGSGDFAARPGEDSGDEIGRLARALGRMASTVGENTEELERLVRERTLELERIAFLDPMTGIANRRGFERRLEDMRSGGGKGALLLLDIDNFKQVNDTFGHNAGDRLVCEIARRVEKAVGDAGLCGRWGGDEFILYFPLDPAGDLKERARSVVVTVADEPVDLGADGRVRMTTSLGASPMQAGDTLDAAVNRADAALYDAKAAGRDRAVVFDPLRHGLAARVPRVA